MAAEKVLLNVCATNLECADNGGALDFLAFRIEDPKRCRAALATAVQN
jgi:hypothetical protein